MSDTSRKILGAHAEEPKDVVMVSKTEVWFRLDGIVFVGKWNNKGGELSITDIKKTPYKEIPFVKVSLVRY